MVAYFTYFIFFSLTSISTKKLLTILILLSPITVFFHIPIVGKSISFFELLIILIAAYYFLKRIDFYLFTINLKKLIFAFLILIPILFVYRDFFGFASLIFGVRLFVISILFYEIFIILKNNFQYQVKSSLLLIELTIISIIPSLIFINFIGSAYEWKLILKGLNLLPNIPENLMISWSASNAISGFYTMHHTLAFVLFGCLSIAITLFNNMETNILIKKYTKRIVTYIIILSLLIILTLSKTIILASTVLILLSLLIKKYKLNYIIFFSVFFIPFLYSPILHNIIEYLNDFRKLYEAFILNGFDLTSILESSHSTSRRLEYFLNSLALIKDNLWIGIGSYGNTLTGELKANPHEFWTFLSLYYGLPYMLLFIVFLLLFFKNFLFMSSIIFILSILVLSFGMSLIGTPREMFPLILNIILLMNIYRIKQNEKYNNH